MIKNDSPWVLGYNEPDMTNANGGCDASPQAAYNAWGDDMFQFYDGGASLVCPAITSDNQPAASWGTLGPHVVERFYQHQAPEWRGAVAVQMQCSGTTLANSFIVYIESTASQVNSFFGTTMLIWVTEFSPMPTSDVQLMSNFLDVAIPWLDAQSYIDRYSPFMADYFVTNDALNVAGETFVHTS
ncbi:uncharacterized protein PAC_08151 [Phialocephala subalpina]|uniref:Asl1-like glycosyl hydrolase catalytic domain-containing protein n=1 Tax=Phialocephala subalpina TaxID=576137 RepID=A0A1L7WZS4_9HELO|nr:uncharacterized protein PAC_08151 [Phialocephala subalpina]